MYNPWGYYIRKESGTTERLSLFVPKLSRKLKEGFSGGTMVKNLPAMQETWVRSLVWEDPLEKGKATHSSILAWRIPWTTVHGAQRVGHNQGTFTFLLKIFIYGCAESSLPCRLFCSCGK